MAEQFRRLPPGSGFKRVGDHLVPVPLTIGMRDYPERPDLEVTFDVIDGRLECRRLVIAARDNEIRTKDLRDVHIDALRETVMANWAVAVEAADERGGVLTVLDVPATEEDSRAAVRSVRSARRKVDNAMLERVAEIYAGAEHAPTQAVADALDIAHRTASLYVSRAREAGLLPPIERGQ